MLSLLRSLSAEPPPAVQAIPERCLRRRLSTCACRLCVDGCPAGALSIDQGELRLDLDKCTECMICVATCPNEAVASHWDLEGMLHSLREQPGKRTFIGCLRQKRRSADEVTIPCLGIFGWEALVSLGRSGCRSIAFDISACPSCENRPGAERFLNCFRQVMEHAPPILTSELTLAGSKGCQPVHEGPDRRSFFAEVRTKISSLALPPPGRVPSRSENSGGRRLPQRVKIIDRILADSKGETDIFHSLCTHRLTVDPLACTPCPRCTGICPTGALRITGAGTEKRLLFSGSRCSGCGLCLSFCRRNALSIFPPPLSLAESQA